MPESRATRFTRGRLLIFLCGDSMPILKPVAIFLVAVIFLIGVCQSNAQKYGPDENHADVMRFIQESDRMTEKDLKQIIKMANSGDPKAQFVLGFSYAYGLDVPKSIKRAVSWYKKSAEQGFAMAQFQLGVIYSLGDSQPDYVKAVKWYNLSAEQGYSGAQYNLGVMYAKGLGIDQDYKKATELYEKAANQGHLEAQFNLGLMYYYGEVVRKDHKKAANWFKKAAEKGDGTALFLLGVMYANGRGVNKDMRKAYAMFAVSDARDGPKEASDNRDLAADMLSDGELEFGSRLAEELIMKIEEYESSQSTSLH